MAVGGQLPDQGADLAHALRVEAVGRLVDNEQLARLEQGSSETEALLHAQRVRLRLLAGGGREPHLFSAAATRFARVRGSAVGLAVSYRVRFWRPERKP
ncbi:hypothetical protein SALBM311S_06106 [Streptomyces alboniger]